MINLRPIAKLKEHLSVSQEIICFNPIITIKILDARTIIMTLVIF